MVSSWMGLLAQPLMGLVGLGRTYLLGDDQRAFHEPNGIVRQARGVNDAQQQAATNLAIAQLVVLERGGGDWANLGRLNPKDSRNWRKRWRVPSFRTVMDGISVLGMVMAVTPAMGDSVKVAMEVEPTHCLNFRSARMEKVGFGRRGLLCCRQTQSQQSAPHSMASFARADREKCHATPSII